MVNDLQFAQYVSPMTSSSLRDSVLTTQSTILRQWSRYVSLNYSHASPAGAMSKALQQVSPSLRSTVYAPPIILGYGEGFYGEGGYWWRPHYILRKGILWH